MEDNKELKGCNGRCETCSINQRSYCSAQKAYYIEQDLLEIKQMLKVKNEGVIETIIVKEDVKDNVIVTDDIA